MPVRRLVLFGLALFVNHGSLGQLGPRPPFELNPGGVEMLRAAISLPDFGEQPGFSFLVGTRERILMTHQFGTADLADGRPIRRDTPFYIASIGKTMTALAVLRLAMDGKLQVEDFITEYLPALRGIGSAVTLMHLLTHRSGVPDYYDVLGDQSDMSNQTILEWAGTLDSLDFDPGYDYRYSNTAYVLLAEVIEIISGQSYSSYLTETFFRPLGMTNTTVPGSSAGLPTNVAVGYAPLDGGSWEVNDRTAWVTGPGGVYSTVDDLYRWYRAIASNEVVAERWTELATHMPMTLSGSISYMTMGWFNETFGRHDPGLQGLAVLGSLGSYRGFRSMMSIFPEQDLVFVLLANGGKYPFGAKEVAEAMLVPRGGD